MSRTRAYTRKMRAKHIKRKKRIVSNWRQFDEYGFYKYDGMFSKGKIHCSCPLCKSKAYYGKHLFTRQEVHALLKMQEALMDPCTYSEARGDFDVKLEPPKLNFPTTLKPLSSKDLYGTGWQFAEG